MRVIPALMLGASCADPAEAPGTGATEPEVELSDSTNAACAIPPELAPVPVDPSAPICFDWSGFTSDGEFDAAHRVLIGIAAEPTHNGDLESLVGRKRRGQPLDAFLMRGGLVLTPI